MYAKIENSIDTTEKVIVCAGLMVLIITVFAAAVLRFFGIDMSISTDLAQLIFCWVSFIGADLALRRLRHMGVDMLMEVFPAVVRNAVALFNYLVILGFLIFCVRYGINLCIVNAARKYQTLYISYSWATSACPVGCALMALTTIRHIVRYVGNFMRHDYSEFKRQEVAA